MLGMTTFVSYPRVRGLSFLRNCRLSIFGSVLRVSWTRLYEMDFSNAVRVNSSGYAERLTSTIREETSPNSAFRQLRFLPLVLVAIETGMRRGELLSLTWDNVHLDKNWVHLPMTKNGESRDVPLSPKARDILGSLPRDISGKVFPIHFEGLKSLWRRAMRRVELDDLHFHDLRHEATSRFFELGLNVVEVAAITGHKDLKMLQRYTHLRAEDLARKLQ